MNAARTRVSFKKAEDAGLVRIIQDPEDCIPIEDLEPDCSGMRPSDAARYKKEWYALIEREGLWIYAVQWRLYPTDRWMNATSIGGIEGDWKDTGHDTDCMQEALDALEKARAVEAENLAVRCTYAGVLQNEAFEPQHINT
jgi:hypothetical protein